jgi:hypothetical protein
MSSKEKFTKSQSISWVEKRGTSYVNHFNNENYSMLLNYWWIQQYVNFKVT